MRGAAALRDQSRASPASVWPKDPRQRLSALLFFDEPRWFSAALQLRYLGAQFEDDLNSLAMPRYWTFDASLARRLFWQLELYAAVENLLNQSYLVGRAGVDTVGQPLFVRAGLRVRDFAARRR
jgi:outer membrane receptor protein involved in Fe transport